MGPIPLAELARINVVGVSGSGKTSLGRRLAELLASPYVEMDALFWKPDWQESSDAELLARVQTVVEQDRWVLDGNYSRTTQLKWQRTQTVVWINLPFLRTLYQVTRRCIQRARDQTELWPGTGNRESFRLSFLSRDSVIWWSITSYHKVQRRYIAAIDNPANQHLRFVRLRSHKQIEEFLDQIKQAQARETALATDV